MILFRISCFDLSLKFDKNKVIYQTRKQNKLFFLYSESSQPQHPFYFYLSFLEIGCSKFTRGTPEPLGVKFIF